MINIILIVKANDFSISALVKWILSTCVNIHDLQITFLEKPNDFHNEIGRLKKLKKLDVTAISRLYLNEVNKIDRFYNYANAAHFLADC